jgi:hypothetical protein
MYFCKAKAPAVLLCFGLLASTIARAECAIDVVVVRGRVEHAPPGATVRVELVYPHKAGSDSGETTLEGTEFTVPIDFFTQSHRPGLIGEWREKCDRKPETVVVTLMGGDPLQEYDRVSLKLSSDFKHTDPGAYGLKSALVLRGRNTRKELDGARGGAAAVTDRFELSRVM